LYVIIGGGSEWLAARLRAAEKREVERLVAAAAADPSRVAAMVFAHQRPLPSGMEALVCRAAPPVIPVHALVHAGFLGLAPPSGRTVVEEEMRAFVGACDGVAKEAGGYTADFRPVDPSRSFCSISVRFRDGRRVDAVLHTILPYVAFGQDAAATPL